VNAGAAVNRNAQTPSPNDFLLLPSVDSRHAVANDWEINSLTPTVVIRSANRLRPCVVVDFDQVEAKYLPNLPFNRALFQTVSRRSSGNCIHCISHTSWGMSAGIAGEFSDIQNSQRTHRPHGLGPRPFSPHRLATRPSDTRRLRLSLDQRTTPTLITTRPQNKVASALYERIDKSLRNVGRRCTSHLICKRNCITGI
jgi:hypothetical protein